jgi:DNA-directed RNA polymerase specialized sigma24 family protein
MQVKTYYSGKIKKVPVGKVISKQDRFIKSICSSWINSFKFDNSIDVDDLCQELRIKLLNDLHTYDPRLSSIKTYIKKIANNFFINKKLKLLSREGHPIDSNGKILIHKLLHDEIIDDDSKVTLIDMIDSGIPTPEDIIEYNQFVTKVREKLNDIKYRPTGFIERRRTFVRKVFDALFDSGEKFVKSILFNYRCRVRAEIINIKPRVPHQVVPIAEAISMYFNVDKRTVDLAFKLIKDVIKKCAQEA